MSESKRLEVMKRLTTHLETEISVANGYKHNLAGAVARGRMWYDTSDPLPMVSILESPNPDRFANRAGEQENVNVLQRDNWTLLLQGWTADDKRHPTDPGYELMADVKKALATLVAVSRDHGTPVHPNYMLGGLIANMQYEPGTVRPPDEQSSKAFFWMRVVLKFVENVNDPYDLT